jgi:hypothetical protein
VSDDPRRLVTREQWERLHVARNHGGLGAACGRTLADGETVYVERLVVDIPRPPDQQAGGYRTYVKAPVGVECASPALLARVDGCEPERCVGCTRPMYYAAKNANLTRAVCSRRCRSRDDMARRKTKTEGPA